MHPYTRARLEEKVAFHVEKYEFHKTSAEVNKVALKEQQRSAQSAVRAARKGDEKEEVKAEVKAEGEQFVKEVSQDVTDDEHLRDMHWDVACQLREILDSTTVTPAIHAARADPVVRRVERPMKRPVSPQLH